MHSYKQALDDIRQHVKEGMSLKEALRIASDKYHIPEKSLIDAIDASFE